MPKARYLRSVLQRYRDRIGQRIISWLLKPRAAKAYFLSDFSRLCNEVKPADVVLVEGQTQVGQIIQMVTHSRWSHSAMCVGTLKQFKPHLPAGYDISEIDPDIPYLVEAELGKGTVLTPISEYDRYRIRVCRPAGLSSADQQKVICYVVRRLGTGYNVRQLADLARFLFPYGILPRKWRSSLFEHNAGPETKIVCSTLMADAFQAVNFPVLPILSADQGGTERLFKRNSRLFAPSDFDISPYFQIMKFPRYQWNPLSWNPLNRGRHYQNLPWANEQRPAAPHDEIDPGYDATENHQANDMAIAS